MEYNSTGRFPKNMKAKDEYFARQFTHFYKRWLSQKQTDKKTGSSTRRTAEDFASEVRKELKKHKINRSVNTNSVSNWKTGKNYPEEATLEAIAKVLNVKKAVFDLDERLLDIDENIDSDNPPQNEIDKVRFEYADQIGLDHDFMLFILSRFTPDNFPDYIRWKKDGSQIPCVFPREYVLIGETEQYLNGTDERSGKSGYLPSIGDGTKRMIQSIQCKFKGVVLDPLGGDLETANLINYTFPSSDDLDYILKLQLKIEKHIEIEVAEAKTDFYQTNARMFEPDPISALKDLQKEINYQRDLENLPKLTLLEVAEGNREFFLFGRFEENVKQILEKKAEERNKNRDPASTFLDTWHLDWDLDVKAILLEAGEDPDQIN